MKPILYRCSQEPRKKGSGSDMHVKQERRGGGGGGWVDNNRSSFKLASKYSHYSTTCSKMTFRT